MDAGCLLPKHHARHNVPLQAERSFWENAAESDDLQWLTATPSPLMLLICHV
jgi:hypothetical protein